MKFDKWTSEFEQDADNLLPRASYPAEFIFASECIPVPPVVYIVTSRHRICCSSETRTRNRNRPCALLRRLVVGISAVANCLGSRIRPPLLLPTRGDGRLGFIVLPKQVTSGSEDRQVQLQFPRRFGRLGWQVFSQIVIINMRVGVPESLACTILFLFTLQGENFCLIPQPRSQSSIRLPNSCCFFAISSRYPAKICRHLSKLDTSSSSMSPSWQFSINGPAVSRHEQFSILILHMRERSGKSQHYNGIGIWPRWPVMFSRRRANNRDDYLGRVLSSCPHAHNLTWQLHTDPPDMRGKNSE